MPLTEQNHDRPEGGTMTAAAPGPSDILGRLLTSHPEAASLLAEASHRRALAERSALVTAPQVSGHASRAARLRTACAPARPPPSPAHDHPCRAGHPGRRRGRAGGHQRCRAHWGVPRINDRAYCGCGDGGLADRGLARRPGRAGRPPGPADGHRHREQRGEPDAGGAARADDRAPLVAGVAGRRRQRAGRCPHHRPGRRGGRADGPDGTIRGLLQAARMEARACRVPGSGPAGTGRHRGGHGGG